MKWAGSDVPVLRRWCAGLVYQFAEAATKFHVKDLFNAVSVRAFLIRQRIKLLSVSFIHWVSDTSTPPAWSHSTMGSGATRLCRFTHHAKVQCGPVIFVPGT